MRAAAADFVRFPADLYPVMTGRVRHRCAAKQSAAQQSGAEQTSRYQKTVVFDHVLSPLLLKCTASSALLQTIRGCAVLSVRVADQLNPTAVVINKTIFEYGAVPGFRAADPSCGS